jgi:hypothetical protein
MDIAPAKLPFLVPAGIKYQYTINCYLSMAGPNNFATKWKDNKENEEALIIDHST